MSEEVMFTIDDFNNTYYNKVAEIKKTKKKISLYFQEWNNKGRTRADFIKGEDGLYKFQSDKYCINCCEESIPTFVNDVGLYNIIWDIRRVKLEKSRESKKLRNEKRKGKILAELNIGDIVKTTTKTPCNNLNLILVDNFSDRYVQGFYVRPNGKRTMEYVHKSLDYIKEIYKKKECDND